MKKTVLIYTGMGILEMPIRICYNASRQKDTSVQDGTAKNPRVATSGVFLFRLGRWLIPKADYQLFISIQPFANIIGDYTCRNRDIK